MIPWRPIFWVWAIWAKKKLLRATKNGFEHTGVDTHSAGAWCVVLAYVGKKIAQIAQIGKNPQNDSVKADFLGKNRF